MAKSKDQHRPGPKLSQAAKTRVIEMAIAGASLKQINQKLHDDGHNASLTWQALFWYRARPEVRDALQRIEAETLQVGLGQRARRMENLNRIVRDNFALIEQGRLVTVPERTKQPDGSYQTVDKEIRVPLSITDVVRCQLAIIRCQAQAAILVGDANMPPMSAAFTAEEAAKKDVEGQPQNDDLMRVQMLTLLADVFELWAKEQGIT